VSAVIAIVITGPAYVSAQLATPGAVGGLTALPRVDPSTWVDQVSKGGFETDPILAAQGGPWTPSGPSSDVGDSTAAWSVDATVAHSGARSMKMYGVAKAEAYEALHLPAGSYTFSGWIKTGQGGTGRARLMVDLRTWRYETVPSSCASDCGINSWYTSQEISAGSNWVQVSTTFTISDADIAAAKANPSFPGTIKAFAVLDGYWAGARLTAWYDDVKLLQQPVFPLDVFMRYPNYRGMLFGDQDQTLKFHVTPSASSGAVVRSTLYLEAGNTVLEQFDTPLTNLTVDADTGKRGLEITLNAANALGGVSDYQTVLAEFRLIDGSGNEVLPRYPTYRVYKVPASARPLMNVSFNTQNQIVVGLPRPNDPAQNPLKMPPAPRFALGVYDSGLGSVSTSTNWEQLLFDPAGARRMNGLPISLYLNYHLGDTDAPTINNLISALDNHSVAYLQTGNCFSSTPASAHNAPTGFKIDQPGADGTYPYVSQPPPTGIGQAVGGYYTADECTADLVDGVFAQYQRLVKWDPDSMTFAALLGSNDLPLWREAADVISTDPYPLYGSEPVGGYNHGQVATWTRMTAQAVQHSRPIMTVLQFFKFDASRSSQGRWPTQAEMRNHAYMAIVEGAKGLMWWSLGDNGLDAVCRTTTTWCSQRAQLMNQLKAVVSEIASLESVLLKPDVTQWAGSVQSVTENTTPATTLPTSAIRTLVKHDDLAGKDYLFAYNTTPYYNASVATPSVTATFQLPASATITVYGENRTVQAGATFSDTFGPFEAHVYVISY
jgi:hypothetical protein